MTAGRRTTPTGNIRQVVARRCGVVTIALTAAVLAGCDSTSPSPGPTGASTGASAATSGPKVTTTRVTDCPDLVMQWAGTVFVNPSRRPQPSAETHYGSNVSCATTETAFRTGLPAGATGTAIVVVNRPGPGDVPGDTPLADYLALAATSPIRLVCNQPPRPVVHGPVSEMVCQRAGTDPAYSVGVSVFNDHAAASAAIVCSSSKPLDDAARDYLVAVARTAAYGALGTL